MPGTQDIGAPVFLLRPQISTCVGSVRSANLDILLRHFTLTPMMMLSLPIVLFLASLSASVLAQDGRARDFGIPFEGKPGPLNAITDVPGLRVGHRTLIEGDNVRTGITTIFPLAKGDLRGVSSGFTTLNGTGEVTGTHLIKELGLFFGPIMLTNTWSVGTARNGFLNWINSKVPRDQRFIFSLPVIAETSDLGLNDQYGMHLTEAHVIAALDNARSGSVNEGNVGGGTGMVAYGFKGGIGTASRYLRIDEDEYIIGVLVQANHDWQGNLRIAGLPIGQMLLQESRQSRQPQDRVKDKNSLIVIIATNIPLLPSQLERIAKRAAAGVGRTGAVTMSVSGEFAIAFSTANPTSFNSRESISHVANTNFDAMNRIFQATAEAVEEALINQLVASETMTGNGTKVEALPVKRVKELLRKHDRLETP